MEDPRRGRERIPKRVRPEWARPQVKARSTWQSEAPFHTDRIRARANGHLIDSLFSAQLAGEVLTQQISRGEKKEFVALMQGEVDRALSWGQVLRELDQEQCALERPGTCMTHARATLERAVNALRDLRHPARYALVHRSRGWRLQVTATFSSAAERSLRVMIDGAPAASHRVSTSEPKVWLLAALVRELRVHGGAAGMNQNPLGRTRVWLDLP